MATPDGGTSAASGERVDVAVSGPVAGFSSMTPAPLVLWSNTPEALRTLRAPRAQSSAWQSPLTRSWFVRKSLTCPKGVRNGYPGT